MLKQKHIESQDYFLQEVKQLNIQKIDLKELLYWPKKIFSLNYVYKVKLMINYR